MQVFSLANIKKHKEGIQLVVMASFVHPSAFVEEGAEIGENTKIWHFVHVRAGAAIGENCNIGKGCYIDGGASLGNNVKVQNFVSVYNGVSIGDDVFVGPGVTFTNDQYPRAFLWSEERVVKTNVEKGASIGANSTILCGIRIGEYAMVGAGSVVTKNVPKHALVYGNPAEMKGFVCKCGRKLGTEKKEYFCECGEKVDLR